jgi:Holliday junction resolvase RusA-like endonuclease
MDATSITFEIPGDPIPQPRARFNRYSGNAYTPDRGGLGAYKAAISLASAMQARYAGWNQSAGPHHIEIHAVFARPKSHFARDGSVKASAPTFPGKNCGDADNLDKAVYDAITVGRGVWNDDSQIVSWGGSKRYARPGEAARVQVVIRRLAT